MPSKIPCLPLRDAVRYIEEHSFSASGDRGPVGSPLGAHAGVEVEWLTFPVANPAGHVPLAETEAAVAAAGTLPGGCRVSFEPGGQLELSSPADLPPGACQAVAEDLAHLRPHLSDAGIGLVGIGLDPVRRERRVLRFPRYTAMEKYFNTFGTEGRTMMCSTTSVQVNLDMGSGQEVEDRWRLVHLVGPVFTAAFASSPFHRGAPTGWRSTRAAVWRAMDHSRTAPVGLSAPGPEAWARYALDARVMLIRETPERFLALTEPLTFREWMTRGHEAGFPDLDDLAYHLTTLFPPVRPRGWLEMRMIDSLPVPWWRVPVLVAAALVHDPEAADRAGRACAPAANRWMEAARHGLAHPTLAAAAEECFTAAIEALPRIGAFGTAAAVTEAFYDRFVARGRSPADDLLDAWASTGALFPTDQPLEPAWI
jgi:glutamate--cysteine ligase